MHFENRLNKTSAIFFFSLLVNLILFTILFVFTKPIYDTDEDVYVLYMLSGGFGQPPTALLHYNYGMHPFLGIILKNLFLAIQSVNWYTWTLITAHFISFTGILCLVLLRNKRLRFLLFYLLLFVVFESRFLLTPNFTNSALACGFAGCLFLFHAIQKSIGAWKYYAVGIIFLVLGSLFRLHVLMPLLVIVLPFVLTQTTVKKSLTVIGILFLASALMLVCNWFQESYYSSGIANWRQEENYRQNVYKFYNHQFGEIPAGHPLKTEFDLLRKGLLIDSNFLSTEKLLTLFNQLSHEQAGQRNRVETTHWFWINTRIFFITVLSLIALLAPSRRILLAVAIAIILAIASWLYLDWAMKFPGYLLISYLVLGSLFLISASTIELSSKRYVQWMAVAIPGLLTAWGIIQLHKMNQKNQQQIEQFNMAYSELSTHANNLFFSIGNGFPLQKYYVFNLSKDFPLNNLITGEHFLDDIQMQELKKYGIYDVRIMYSSPALIFCGKPVPALIDYFYQVEHVQLKIYRINEFDKIEAYRLSTQ